MSDDKDLRASLTRLAFENPNLRDHLLPILASTEQEQEQEVEASGDDDGFHFDFQGMYTGGHNAAGITDFFNDRALDSDYYKSVSDLMKKSAKDGRLFLDAPMASGTRVAFIGDLDSMLTYGNDFPADGLGGAVVKVRAAAGDVTAEGQHVFVLWDDGKFRPVLARHMRLEPSKKRGKVGDKVRIVTSNLGDISSFFTRTASSKGGELVHKATKDLWSFRQEGGQYVIERLFDSTGTPIKEQ